MVVLIINQIFIGAAMAPEYGVPSTQTHTTHWVQLRCMGRPPQGLGWSNCIMEMVENFIYLLGSEVKMEGNVAQMK